MATPVHLARHPGLDYPLAATKHGLADALGEVLDREPHAVPVVGPPAEFAMPNTPGVETGYRAIVPAESDWENACPARAALQVPLYRPISSAHEVDAPPSLTVATGDRIVPLSAAERLARRLEHVELLRLDCGHFDVYNGPPFERAAEEQAAFPPRPLR